MSEEQKNNAPLIGEIFVEGEAPPQYYQAFLNAQKKSEDAAAKSEAAAGRAVAAAEKINVDQEYIETQVFAAGGSAEVAATAARNAAESERKAKADADRAEAAAERAESSGGGGGSADAVTYTPQSLTPKQQAQARENIGAAASTNANGLSSTANNLLINILRNAVYSSDQSANITALETALSSGGGGDEPDVPDVPDVPVVGTYTITSELVNVNSSNNASSVTEGTSYTATLTAADGYNLDSVVVTMGGVDVTADVYADGVISISAVTGNVEIVASASAAASKAELITDGLMAYFDFRTAEYNNAGSGGSTTIAATQGAGQLFAWANNCVEVQDERGIHFANSRSHTYSQAGDTTETDIGASMTLIMLTYGQAMSQGFAVENVGARWAFKPKYTNTSGNTVDNTHRSSSEYNADDKSDYNFCVYRVDGNTLTEIMDTSVATYNGGDIDGFAAWYTKVGVKALNGADDGIYCTAAAIYNRALTDVEIEEMRAFMKTLEVTA